MTYSGNIPQAFVAWPACVDHMAFQCEACIQLKAYVTCWRRFFYLCRSNSQYGHLWRNICNAVWGTNSKIFRFGFIKFEKVCWHPGLNFGNACFHLAFWRLPVCCIKCHVELCVICVWMNGDSKFTGNGTNWMSVLREGKWTCNWALRYTSTYFFKCTLCSVEFPQKGVYFDVSQSVKIFSMLHVTFYRFWI